MGVEKGHGHPAGSPQTRQEHVAPLYVWQRLEEVTSGKVAWAEGHADARHETGTLRWYSSSTVCSPT